jgi:hypothetical protein
MSWSIILTLGLILTVVSIMAQRGRRSLNHKLGAHHRPLFGPFAIILICLVGYFMFVKDRPAKVEFAHPQFGAYDWMRDMQEDLAIHRGTRFEDAHRTMRKIAVEREKVRRMIDDAATAEKDEIVKVSSDDAKVDPAVVEAEDSTPPAPPAPRPKWLDEPTGLVNGVYYRTVVAGPYATRAACEEAMPAELNAAVDQFVDSYLGPGASQIVHLPLSYIKDEIAKQEYEETYSASFGPMKNLHRQLAFDRKVCEVLKQRYHNALAEVRMKEFAIGAGGVLLLLGTMFSYLKLDTATRGYYTGRLRLATALAILGGGAAAFSLVRHL